MSDIHGFVPLLFQALFVFCVCYAIVSDFTRLTIPNWIPLVLVGAFVPFALLYVDPNGLPRHLLMAGVVFCLGFVFFALGWIGGGDVKLLTAVTLWVGAPAAPQFVMIMAVLGAALAGALFTINHYSDEISAWVPRNWLVRRLLELAQTGRCPYGVAIGIAGLTSGGGALWQTHAVL
jgi:prepilin peptidase CpaA